MKTKEDIRKSEDEGKGLFQMMWIKVSNLDYIAVKLEGMATRFMDDGDQNTALELLNMAATLKDISKAELNETLKQKTVEEESN